MCKHHHVMKTGKRMERNPAHIEPILSVHVSLDLISSGTFLKGMIVIKHGSHPFFSQVYRTLHHVPKAIAADGHPHLS